MTASELLARHLLDAFAAPWHVAHTETQRQRLILEAGRWLDGHLDYLQPAPGAPDHLIVIPPTYEQTDDQVEQILANRPI